MTDRRRNIIVLTTVVALLIGSLVVIFTKPTKLGLDLQGGVQLVYEARPTKQQPKINQESLDRALDIMRDRVDSLGVAEPELQRSGSDQIEVSLPGVKNAERAADQVGTTAQMYFYDWEPNILDADCKTNPEEVNGGQQPISGLYNAVKRASKCPPEIDANNTTNGLWYAFDKKSHAPINDGIPDETKAALEEDLQSQNLTDKAEILEVPEGVIVLRAVDDRNPDQKRGQLDQWWVLKDNPVLGGTDIKNPEQNFEGGSGGPPIVTMEFSDKGRKAFAATTRAIAQRGADNAAINGGLQDPINASHHFAIRLDNELISTPYINFRENPDGIDGQQGAQISGGFTIQTAQDLARLLKIGALPVRLELISRSQVSATLGQQALDQGLIAGIAGFAIVALFLLVFYRVMGVIAVAAARHLRDLPARADQADPDHDDAAGHRRPDPHDRRRGRREHRHLRTRQRGDQAREIRVRGHRTGLQEGLRDDRRRERRHAARRLHPLHPRDRGRQGLRVRARRRDDGLAVHRGVRDPGDPAVAARTRSCSSARPRWARRRSASRSRSTSWARRSGSSRCPA